MIRPHLPKIDDLKKRASLIHYFGLGFIQVKMESAWQRFHFYTHVLPSIKEGVHNHRYGFKSRVMRGDLNNFVYVPESGDTHIEYSVSCKPDVTNIASIMKRCKLGSPTHNFHLSEGSEYSMRYDTFHRVVSHLGAITEINPGIIQQSFARVVDPVNTVRECPFANPGDPEQLWEIVDSMLKQEW